MKSERIGDEISKKFPKRGRLKEVEVTDSITELYLVTIHFSNYIELREEVADDGIKCKMIAVPHGSRTEGFTVPFTNDRRTSKEKIEEILKSFEDPAINFNTYRIYHKLIDNQCEPIDVFVDPLPMPKIKTHKETHLEFDYRD